MVRQVIEQGLVRVGRHGEVVPADAVGFTMLQRQLEQLLDSLSEREAGVIRMRFGLGDGMPKTLDQIGDTFGVTRERIAEAAIGRQEKTLNMANGAFVRELCDSRTFCLQADVDRMRANGLALGGTLENAVVFENGEVLSPGGLRHSDEPVRHKMLDALGDLSLAGGPLLGRYTGIRAGHALTNRLLRALFAQPDAWVAVDCGGQTMGKLPGMGVHRGDLPAHC